MLRTSSRCATAVLDQSIGYAWKDLESDLEKNDKYQRSATGTHGKRDSRR